MGVKNRALKLCPASIVNFLAVTAAPVALFVIYNLYIVYCLL